MSHNNPLDNDLLPIALSRYGGSTKKVALLSTAAESITHHNTFIRFGRLFTTNHEEKFEQLAAERLSEAWSSVKVQRNTPLFDCRIEKTIEGLVRSNKSLQVLDLGGCDLSVRDSSAFGKAIREAFSTGLRKLNLWWNDIGDEGGVAIGEALQGSKSLEELDLCANRIRHGGARSIAEGLKRNTTLRKLNLDTNFIGDDGCRAICSALEVNQRLTCLNIGRNRVTDTSRAAIGVLMLCNATLKDLDLHDNSISDEGAAVITRALESAPVSLRMLNLSNNEIGDSAKCQLQRSASQGPLNLIC